MKLTSTLFILILFLAGNLSLNAQEDPCLNFAANFGFSTGESGLNVQFTNQSTGEFTNVIWFFGDDSESIVSSPFHAYEEVGVYYICLYIENELCNSQTCKTVELSEAGTACEAHFNFETEGLTAGFNGNPSVGEGNIVSWVWGFGDGTGSDNGAEVNHTYSAAGTYNVCLTITTANGCTDDYCHTVTVTSGTTPLCAAHFNFDTEGLNGFFNGNISEANSDIIGWAWNFGDGSNGDGGPTTSHAYATPGVYIVCLTITTGNGCVDDICIPVTITGEEPNPVCEAFFNYETTGLVGFFNGSPSGGNSDIIGWQWSFGDGTGSDDIQVSHTYGEAGTYNVCLTITTANGCIDDYCHTVTVSGTTTPVCAAHFNFETEGLTAWFNGNTSEANGDITGWVWSFGDGTSSDNGAQVNHTYSTAGTYTVCLIITTGNGCVDDICHTVTVTGGAPPLCAAHFNFETEGLTAWFNGNTSEANGEITGWVWNFGDGTSSDIGAQVNHTYTEAGTYTVCLTITTGNGCVDDICHTVTVTGGTTPLCAAHFNFETEGLTAWFNGNTSEANSDIISWVWSFGEGTTSGNGIEVSHTFTEAGTYTVCLTITTGNGCVDDICQTITVTGGTTPLCAAHFNFDTEGLTAWFNGNTSEANGDIIGWVWSFGDGTSSDNGAQVNHTYTEAGTYTVCLTITTGNGCVDDICHTVTVTGGTTPLCAAHFNFETEGLTAWFNGNPSEANGEIISWVWSFGDGTGSSIGAQVNHVYSAAGSYTVCLIITTANGCMDDLCQTVTVTSETTPVCEAYFNFETEGLTAWFNGNPSTANGDIANWSWSFGDGTSATGNAEVNHIYAESGTYTVCLTITTGNGCVDDYCHTVTVSSEPPTPVCEAHYNFETDGLTAWFNANPSTSNGTIVGWLWSFGDESGSADGPQVNHTFAEAGTYNVCVTITTSNGCVDDYCHTVTVAGGTTPTCEAFFHSENNELTVFFNGNPSTANSTIVSWEWSFGDGTGSSSGAQVNHAYTEEGQYVVCLIITASNGCTDDYCKEVNVILESSIPACSAHFNFETEGLSAWFNGNASESNGNIESWSWDFGDGTSSTAGAEVNHAYTTGGTYTVCLVITTNNECEDDYCFEVIVENPASGNKLAIPYNVTTNENITAIITLENAQPVKVLISDLSGRRTKLSDINLLSGENQIELNIGNQLPGTYFVAIELANGSLLKQRIFKLD